MTLVSTHELDNSLSDNAKLIDASWHFLSNRNGFKEYQKEHIENAIFFDLDKYSNQRKDLPHNHFLPEKKEWEATLSKNSIFYVLFLILVKSISISRKVPGSIKYFYLA